MKQAVSIITIALLIITTTYSKPAPASEAKSPKRLNIFVYFAGNNNLYKECIKQLDQMTRVDLPNDINVIAQLDMQQQPALNRYLIRYGHAPVHIETVSNCPAGLSGTPESLISFVQWGMDAFPAESIYLILANHGDGIKDKTMWNKKNNSNKGICFNDVAQRYLSNQDLERALGIISQNVLNGQKIPLLLTDACFMSMVEICSQVKQHVAYFVGSQDAEPSSGYDYIKLLSGFNQSFGERLYSPDEFARYTTACFLEAHKTANRAVTQSAVNLSMITPIEENIARLGALCSECINIKSGFFEALQKIRKTKKVVFRDPDYIDLYTFYQELIATIKPHLSSSSHRRKEVVELAEHGIQLLNQAIIANVANHYSKGAHGLSLYFPEYRIHESYYKTIFDQKTSWSNFLKNYWYHSYMKSHTPYEKKPHPHSHRD